MEPAVTTALIGWSNLHRGTCLELRGVCEASNRGERQFFRLSPVPIAGGVLAAEGGSIHPE